MIRTQVQLPDELYERTKRLAESKEISLAELVRRGLEYMLSVNPLDRPPRHQWKLDSPSNIGLLQDPFADPDWRVAANMRIVAAQDVPTLMLNEGEGKKP